MSNNRKLAHWLGCAGIALLALMLLLALVGPYVVAHDSRERTGAPLERPGAEHWLGTNDIGQDILAELVVGAKVSFTVGLVGAVLVMIIGALIGMIAGYFGGWPDMLFMRLVDVSMTLPFLPLMIVIGVFLSPGIGTQIMIISLVMWAKVARELRSQIISLRTRGPVLAAASMGASHPYLMRKHIFPALFPLLIPQFVQTVNGAIMLESSLSFLGLGDPLAKSWGSMLFYANARSAFLTEAWLWWVLPPGLCIVATVLGCTFIGYWLEEKVSPLLSAYVPQSGRRFRQRTDGAGTVGSVGRVGSSGSGWMKADAGQDSIVEVKGLEVMFPKAGRTVQAVRGIDLNVRRGEIVGIVGESGSGKSTVGAAIMQLLKPPAVWSGHVRFDNLLLEQLTSAQLRSLRGKRMALVPQAAMNALNPVLSIRTQMREAIRLHGRIPLAKADERIDELLLQVGLEAQWGSAFPHELSGGMKQRVVIATALLNEPELIIADEPTTGLDVMVQAEIVRLLVRLQRQYGMAMIFISHDLPVVMKLANRMLMMKDGQIVEQGETAALRTRPEHPYTRKLLAAIPRLAAEGRQDE